AEALWALFEPLNLLLRDWPTSLCDGRAGVGAGWLRFSPRSREKSRPWIGSAALPNRDGSLAPVEPERRLMSLGVFIQSLSMVAFTAAEKMSGDFVAGTLFAPRLFKG